MDETTTAVEQQESVEIRMATIAEIFEDGVTLIFDGQEEATDKHYKCNTSAKLAVGDRVMLDSESGTYVVAYAVGNPSGGGEGSHELPAGGTDGQVLTKDGATDYTVKWGTIHQVPAGGTTGQVLRKKSSTAYDLEWGSISRDVPTGGTDGQVLLKDGSTDYAVKWGDIKGVPPGGSLGQVLRKKSAANYDLEWGSIGALPTGGTAGQYLKKSSATNYAAEWADAPSSLPTGGSDGQVLTKSGSTNYSVKWATPPNPLPTGGSADQVLTKSSATNYAVKWADAAASQLKSGIYTLKLSGNTLTPSGAGFTIGTAGSGAVKVCATSIVIYYNSYRYCTLACNSSGKLTVNGTAVG